MDTQNIEDQTNAQGRLPDVAGSALEEQRNALAEARLRIIARYEHVDTWLYGQIAEVIGQMKDYIGAQQSKIDELEMIAKTRMESLITVSSDRDALAEAVKLAYRKHHMGDEDVGWNELSDRLHDALCNSMGDAGYQRWVAELEGRAAAEGSADENGGAQSGPRSQSTD